MRPFDNLLTNIRYVLYGFGINSALVLALGGWIINHIAGRIKRINNLHEQFGIFKQQFEDYLGREDGRKSFSNGLVTLESKQKLDHQDIEMIKRWLRDLEQRCDNTHRVTANRNSG